MAGDPITDLYEPAPVAPETLTPYQPATPHPSGFGAFGRAAALGTAPSAGGIAAVPAGAAAGAGLVAPIAPLAGPAAPLVEGAGSIAGGGLAAFGGGWLIDKAQTAIIHALPGSVTSALGIDDASRARDQAAHPTASFLGSVAPQLAFMRPSWGGVRQALVGAGIGGGLQAGQDYADTGTVDPLHVAAQAVIGGALGRNTRLGDLAQAPAHWAVERVPTGAGLTQAAIGARTVLQGAGDVVAGTREAALARLFPLTPRAIRDRWAAAGTMDDVIKSDALTGAVGADHLTPDEQAAGPVAEDAAITRASSPFQPGPAGDAEHGLRLSATMQALLAGQAPPPIGAPAQGAGTRAALLSGSSAFSGTQGAAAKIIGAESGGRADARNPYPGQTAAGLGQFTDATWLSMYRKHFGGLGMSDATILAERAKPDVSRKMTELAMGDYQALLQRGGVPVTDGNLYLVHFLGPRALDVLHADPATPIEALVPHSWTLVNPQLRGRTAGQVRAWTDAKMGGSGEVPPGGGTAIADAAPGEASAGEAPDPAAFDPAPYRAAMRDYVRDTRRPLTADAIADHLGLDDVEQARRVQGMLAGSADAGVTVGRDGALRRQPVRQGPPDVATVLADAGGIRNDEGHDLIAGRNLQRMVPGAGPLVRRSGMSIDAAGELLWSRGFFGPPDEAARPSEDEVLQLLERTRHGKVLAPEEEAGAAVDDVDRDEIASHMHSRFTDMNVEPDQRELDRVTDLVAGGLAPEDAMEKFVSEEFDAANLRGEAETDGEHKALEAHYALSADQDEGWPRGDDPPYGPDDIPPHYYERDEGAGGAGGGAAAGAGPAGGDPAGDAGRLTPFDQPAGDGARAQAESLEHDLAAKLKLAKPTVPQSAAPDDGLGPASVLAFLPSDGKPGVSLVRDGDDLVTAVFRDKNGKSQGAVQLALSAAAREMYEGVSTFVRPAFRRQGIANRLYDALADDGYPIDQTSGSGDLTPDGAALVNARRSRQDNSVPSIERLLAGTRGVPLEELHAGAARNQAELGTIGAAIAEETGAAFKNPGVKKLARVREKMALEGYADAGEIKDMTRGAFVVDNPAQADAVMAAIGRDHAFFDKGWRRLPDSGYLDRKLIVRFANGGVGEVQIVPREVWNARKGGLGKLYGEGRATPDPARKAALDAEQRAGYAAALESSGWASLSSAGQSAEGNIRSASARDSRVPSDDALLTSPGASRQEPSDQAQAARTSGDVQTLPTARSSTSNSSSDIGGSSERDVVPADHPGNLAVFDEHAWGDDDRHDRLRFDNANADGLLAGFRRDFPNAPKPKVRGGKVEMPAEAADYIKGWKLAQHGQDIPDDASAALRGGVALSNEQVRAHAAERFRLDEGGDDRTLQEVLDEADADVAAAGELRACLPPKGGPA